MAQSARDMCPVCRGVLAPYPRSQRRSTDAEAAVLPERHPRQGHRYAIECLPMFGSLIARMTMRLPVAALPNALRSACGSIANSLYAIP